MYGISAYKFGVNLRKYHIHGASGYGVSDHVVQVEGILVIGGHITPLVESGTIALTQNILKLCT